MLEAKWKPGFSLFKADAQRVAEELAELGDEITPARILDKARDSDTELHKCFEWDDTVAAEKYRLTQARQIVCHLVIKERQDPPEGQAPRRVYYKTSGDGGYKPTTLILRNESEWAALKARCEQELAAIMARYKTVLEMEHPALWDELSRAVAS